MRVAYVCTDPGVPVFGRKGASVHVQGILGALVRSGASVTLLARRTGGEPPTELRDVALRPLSRVRSGDPAERERLLAAGNADVAEVLDREAPFDVVFERHALWSWAAMEWASGAGATGILEVNAPLVAEQGRHRALADAVGAEDGVRRAYAAASAIVAVSEEVAAHVASCRQARGKIDVVPNGVDPQRFSAAPSGGADRPFTVGFLGTLKPWHGLETLVGGYAALCRDVPDARLLVVGDGPGRDALADALADAGVAGGTTLTGPVDPAGVPALLAQMDVGVAPYPASREHYFSPLKVLEYLAAGLPVVASRIGQIPDLVEHGVTGLLCPPGDPGALAAALRRIAGDPGFARTAGNAARERVLATHTWDHVLHRILSRTPRLTETVT